MVVLQGDLGSLTRLSVVYSRVMLDPRRRAATLSIVSGVVAVYAPSTYYDFWARAPHDSSGRRGVIPKLALFVEKVVCDVPLLVLSRQ